MFQHKKFQAALLASLIALLGGYATGLAETGDFVQALMSVDWTATIAPWLAAIAAQGVADFGKEKAAIEQNGSEGG
jgi:hypothetical protein